MRKDVLNPKGFKLFNDISVATNQTSDIVYIPFLDNVGITVHWSGSSIDGELKIEVSNQQENPQEAMSWIELDFGQAIMISGNSGNHLINCNNVPFNALRLRYVATSGSGTLTAILQSKMV